MMIKDFLRHGIIYGVGNFLTRGVSFLLLPFYTRILSTVDYGITSSLSSLMVFCLPIISLEVSQAIGIYYSEAKDIQDQKKYIATGFNFLILSNFIFLLIGLIFYRTLSEMLFGKHINNHFILIALFSTSLSTIFNFVQNQLLWRLKSICYSVISFVTSIVTILITIFLVLMFKFGVVGILLAGLIGNSFGVFLGLIYSKKFFGLKFDFSALKKLLHFSLPLVPSTVGYYTFLYFDQIMVMRYLGLAQAGIYGVASRFVIIISLLIYALGNSLPPLIYQHHQKAETKQALEKITRLFLIVVFVSISALLFLGKDIILLLTTPDYLPASPIIPLLVMGTFFANMYLLTPGLGISKKTKWIASFNILGGIVNLIGNILLVPRYKLIGAASATLSSSILVFSLYFIFSQRFYKIDYQWRKINAAFLFFIFSCLIFSLFNFQITDILMLDIFIKLIPILLVSIIFIYILTDAKDRSILASKFSLQKITSQ